MVRLKAIVRPKLEEAVEVLQDLARAINGDSDTSSPGAVDDRLV